MIFFAYLSIVLIGIGVWHYLDSRRETPNVKWQRETWSLVVVAVGVALLSMAYWHLVNSI